MREQDCRSMSGLESSKAKEFMQEDCCAEVQISESL